MSSPEANQFIYTRRPVPLREFIEFWAAGYDEPESIETLYTGNINGPHTEATLSDLFRWKIGAWLFKKHLTRTVMPHFISQMEKVKQLPPDISARDFLQEFPNGGAIYRIFWLHCWHPDRYPIYDQHVHRAMNFIRQGRLDELSEYTDQQKIESYLGYYVPFFEQFGLVDLPFDPIKDGVPGRKADRALLMFGSFLLKKWLLDGSASFPCMARDNLVG